MNISIDEYRERLLAALYGFDPAEVAQAVDYYTELLEDAEDVGAQMDALGSPEELARRIIAENGWSNGSAAASQQTWNDTAGQSTWGSTSANTFTNDTSSYTAGGGSKVGRILLLVLLSPLWLTVYCLVATLLLVIGISYIALPLAAIASVFGGIMWAGKLLPYGIAILLTAVGLIGLSVLLFRPALSGVGGTAGLFKRFSRFLFIGKRAEQDYYEKPERRPFDFKLLIIGGALAVFGFAVGIPMMMGFVKDNSRLATAVGLDKVEREISADSTSFDIDIKNVGDVKILRSEDGTAKIEAEAVKADSLTISENDGISVVYDSDSVKMMWFWVNVPSPTIKIYLPDKEYKRISVNSNVGDVKLNDLTVNELSAQLDVGDIKMENVKQTGEELLLKNNTGDIKIQNSTFTAADEQNSRIETHTGDVKLMNTNVENKLYIGGQVGSIKIEGMTAGSIDCRGDVGDIKIQDAKVSKDMYCSTNVGDIKLALNGSDYNVKADTDIGDVKVNGGTLSSSGANGSIPVNAHSGCGDVKIDCK